MSLRSLEKMLANSVQSKKKKDLVSWQLVEEGMKRIREVEGLEWRHHTSPEDPAEDYVPSKGPDGP